MVTSEALEQTVLRWAGDADEPLRYNRPNRAAEALRDEEYVPDNTRHGIDHLGQIDNRRVASDVLEFNETIVRPFAESVSCNVIRVAGGRVATITSRKSISGPTEERPEFPRIGLFLARTKEALELLLLLSEGPARSEAVAEELGVDTDHLTYLVSELRHFGLVMVTSEGPTLSYEGTEFVSELSRAAEKVQREHGRLSTES